MISYKQDSDGAHRYTLSNSYEALIFYLDTPNIHYSQGYWVGGTLCGKGGWDFRLL